MDVKRPGTRKRQYQRYTYAGVAVLGFVVLAVFAWQLAGRPPGVDSDTVFPGEVTQGAFVHEVTGSGSLIALEVRTITSRSGGVVEKIDVLAGHIVDPHDVLVHLSSPTLLEELTDAESDLEAAEADELLRKAEAEDNYFDLLVSIASAEAAFETARMEATAQEMLQAEGAASTIDVQRATSRADTEERRLEASRAKFDRYPQTLEARDTAAESKLDKQRRSVERLREKVDELAVPAGFSGVVQEVLVDEGQRLSDGSEVAKIVNPDLLVARVRVSERDAALVQLGQTARLEMGRQTLQGKVTRIEPTVRERLVTVDIELDGTGHTGLRPDLTVTARIEIQRVDDTLVLEKPTYLRDDQTTIDLFRLNDDGSRATRVEVEVGRISTRDVEIVRGLEAGDQVLLSNMTDWLEEPEIRLR